MMSKAQVAMEYLMIVGFVAVITLPLILIFETYSKQTSQEITSAQIYQIAKRISDSAETVYYLGEPSKLTMKVYFPSNVDSISVTGNEIVFNVRTRLGNDEIVVYSPINLAVSIEIHQGVHYIKIQSQGDLVSVTG